MNLPANRVMRPENAPWGGGRGAGGRPRRPITAGPFAPSAASLVDRFQQNEPKRKSL